MRRRLMMKSKPNVDSPSGESPSDYTWLNYIESTGQQYIDIGFSIYSLANPSVEIEMKKTTTNIAFNGVYHPTQHFQIGLNNDYASFRLNANESVSSHTIDPFEYHVLYSKSGLQKLDNVIVGDTVSAPTENNISFILFGRSNPVNVSWNNGIELYAMSIKYFEVKDGEVLVMKLLPAQDRNGEVGMYDIVSQKFFTNQGTGLFIGG